MAPPTAGGGASQADEWRAYAAAAAAYEAAAAGGADAADARRAFEGAPRESLAQPRAEGGQPRTRAAAKAKALLRRVKGAGIAGVISFGLVQARVRLRLRVRLRRRVRVCPNPNLVPLVDEDEDIWRYREIHGDMGR